MRVVSTAGHVDHGKSALLRALTGTDPDRLAEEQRRGLTIDLGFVFTTLPSGTQVGFVDVPGHVRFLKNMLAGMGAVDVVLLVVAADEGWMPQSEEHLRILELLGVNHGVVAVTKADLVDEDTVELARLEVGEHLAGSSLAPAPVVVTDARTGRGLGDLRAALDRVLTTAPAPADHRRPRLWVDRVFVARGAGTIVTGTLTGGGIAVDETVLAGSEHRPVRVRGIESAGRRLEHAEPGSRVALNLAGVEHHDLARGQAVVRPDQWAWARVVDVALRPLPGVRASRRGRVHAHVGSGQHRAWLRVLDDGQGFARLRLDDPIPLAPGDRLVLRDPGPDRTVAGAEVLDVAPIRRVPDAVARLGRSLGERLLDDGFVAREALIRRSGRTLEDAVALVEAAGGVAVGEWFAAASVLAAVREHAAREVTLHLERSPHTGGMEISALAAALRLEPAVLRAAIAGAPGLVVEQGRVRPASAAGRVSDSDAGRATIATLDAEPFAPPPVEDPALVPALAREGAVVVLDGIVFSAAALERARAAVVDCLRRQGHVTVADVRDLLSSTRKYVLPIVGWLDRQGITRRRGDDRVPGPASGLT